MTVAYGEFKMPKEIKSERSDKPSVFGRFVAEPFERGFGHTIGNSMRRMLLSSLEAPSIVSICLEGVPHEYMPIEGVIEDMTNVILNLKGALLRKLPQSDEVNCRGSRILTHVLDISQEQFGSAGQYRVTLGDIISSEYFEVVNPDLYLFTVTAPFKRQVDLRVSFGRGYVPSERHMIEDKNDDEIAIDAAYSPVRLVNYFVENTRVGQHTDFDKLILEVTTDGRVSPQEAVNFAAQIGIKHYSVFNEVDEKKLSFDKIVEEVDDDHDMMMQKLVKRIDEIELSVRSTNCLSGANIATIAELVTKPESEMLQFRNFGKKSLNEIKAKLVEMNLGLGMDLTKYGITRDNVRTVVAEYLEQMNSGENA